MQSEVVIIGGGPAGSTLGCYLSMAGISNTIIESAIHPREHVGESMVTASTRIFDEIGFLDTMEQERFVRKFGASWHPTMSNSSLHVEFAEVKQEGICQDHTYHVDRARFDLLLLKHAERLGSRVIQGVNVREVLFKDGVANGVRAAIAGHELNIPARVTVDASGRRTLLGSQLKLKETDPNFNQFAVHAWFERVERGERPGDIHIYFLPIKRGWVWQIPINKTITSVGVVAEKEVFKAAKGDYETWFYKLAGSTPDIARALKPAQRLNELKVEADYSYQMTSFVGEGWMLVGDAARFVDPIFSSGVSVAMHSAKFASEQIVSGLAKNNVSREALYPFEEKLKQGTKIWYEFISLYYRLLPVFTLFISNKVYRDQVIQLLQGDVYNYTEVPVLQAMRDFIKTVETTKGHLLQPYLDHDLQDITNAPAPQE